MMLPIKSANLVDGKFISMMMEVSLLVAVIVSVVVAQGEVPIQRQQQQGVPIQNQGHQQVQVDQVHQQQQEQLRQQKILVQQQQQHRGQATMTQGGRNLIRDKTHIQDREHIKLHLNGIIDQDETEMSGKELELHYFKMHDYDNNMKLDGLEILQAVSHFHQEGTSEDTSPLDDSELIQLIDPILEEDDKNRDGYVDYPEFAATKQ